MLHTVETDKSMARLREDLPKACTAHKFGVLGTIDLRDKMHEKGVAYAGECVIFEVCNPHKAKQALEADPRISTVLPCRISVYRAPDGKTRLSTVRPTLLMEMFGTAGLRAVAEEVETTLAAIMEEAARC